MSGKYDGSKGPPEIEGMASLKVDNLTYRTSIDDLERYFKKFGKVGDIYIPRDRNTHESRGFAFVRYYDERDADEAMELMDGKVIDGREIRVAMARYGRPSNQRNQRHSSDGRHRDGRSDKRSSYRDHSDSSYGNRRRSPQKQRSRSRSHSYQRSRSRSRSPQRYHRRSLSRSPGRRLESPLRSRPKSRSRSRSRSLSYHSRDD